MRNINNSIRAIVIVTCFPNDTSMIGNKPFFLAFRFTADLAPSPLRN